MFKSFVTNKVTNQDKRNYGPDYEVIFWYKETLCNNLSIQFMMHHIFFKFFIFLISHFLSKVKKDEKIMSQTYLLSSKITLNFAPEVTLHHMIFCYHNDFSHEMWYFTWVMEWVKKFLTLMKWTMKWSVYNGPSSAFVILFKDHSYTVMKDVILIYLHILYV